MGFESDTVPCPRAMMVHSHYTLTTDAAVMSSWWLDLLTFLADSEAHERLIVWIYVDRILHAIKLLGQKSLLKIRRLLLFNTFEMLLIFDIFLFRVDLILLPDDGGSNFSRFGVLQLISWKLNISD